jgi:hypothetical protein
MLERIRSLREQGKQVLLVDLSNCPPSEVEHIARTLPDYVTTRPRGSVLLLVDFTGASFDREAIRAMKESSVFDKPYIKKSAWVGTAHLPIELHAEITNFSRRKIPIFSSTTQAVSWLVSD